MMAIPRIFPGACSFSRTLLVAVTVLFVLGWLDSAQAVAPPPFAACSAMKNYGFTMGVVYCVQGSIFNAVISYLTVLQLDLAPYCGMAMVVAIILFGIRLMTANLKDPKKDIMTFVFRLMIGTLLFNYGANIYTDIAGYTTDAGIFGGIMNEVIGWTMGLGGDFTLFGDLSITHCTAPAAPPGMPGSQVWQTIDCMFQRILGAANPATNPAAFGISMLWLLAASVLSGTMAIGMLVVGVGTMLSALLFVFRAVYLVLLAYVCMGFLVIFTPLIAPLIFFKSDFLTDKFKRWVSLILSTIIQPMMVMGFLAFGITVADQFIEGTFAPPLLPGAPGCQLPTYQATSGTGIPPSQGWGQNGSGVCSFSQLMDQGLTGVSLESLYKTYIEQNSTLFNWTAAGDTKLRTDGVTPDDPNADLSSGQSVPAVGINQNPILASTTSYSANHVNTLKPFIPIKQLILTMICFLFTVHVLKSMLDKIPLMAEQITIMVGARLYSVARSEMESFARDAFSKATGAMEGATRGKGLLSGNGQGISSLGDAFMAAGRSSIKSANQMARDNL